MSTTTEYPRAHADSWRVVVFTTSGEGGAYSFLDGVLQSLGHRIVGVVTSPGPRGRRSEDYRSVVEAAEPEVEVIISTHPRRWAAMVAPMRPDLIVSAAFPMRIPKDVIELPRLGAINGHPALLPKYRGPNPQGWVFRNNDAETGYTIHRLACDFDAGPILAQARVPVCDEDDTGSVFERLMPLLPGVFAEAFARVARGEPGEVQDEALASGAPFFEDCWQRIDWSRPARTIHNQVRSLFELPGQSAGGVAEIEGSRVRILKTRLVVCPSGGSGRYAPGTVVGREGGELLVQCGDGALRVLEWGAV
ncbi:MAG: methionyl-tRNA formyltransferase [Thermomicrobiales bacterium]|nr:methionyl-tRNA formyltransferase [Thermomicrobiales bacterium]